MICFIVDSQQVRKKRVTKFKEKLHSNQELLDEYRRKERERLGLEMLQQV